LAAAQAVDAVGGDDQEAIGACGLVARFRFGHLHHIFPAGASAFADAETEAGAGCGLAFGQQGAQFRFGAIGEGDQHGQGQ